MSARKAASVLLAASILLLSPGAGCWRALAQGSRAAAGTVVRGGALGVPAAPALPALSAPVLTTGLELAAPFEPAAGSAALPAAAAVPAASAEVERAERASETPLAAETALPAPASVEEMLADPRSVAAPAEEVAELGPAEASSAGRGWMDRVLGAKSFSAAGPAVPAGALAHRSPLFNRMPPPWLRGDRGAQEPPAARPTARSEGGGGGRAAALLRVVAAAAAVVGLHSAAAALLPAAFGMVPIAALWAVSSGILLVPIALYHRHRLALRDSERLAPVKRVFDLVLGAFLGAAVVAGIGMSAGAGLAANLGAALPTLSDAFASAGAALSGEGASGVLDWLRRTFVLPFLADAGASPLTLGALFGLVSLPVMTTLSFLQGRIIRSAESGQAFSAPGIRLSAYTWVMTGVVFALLTGYSPLWTTAVFLVWNVAGHSKLFNRLFLAAAAWSVLAGFLGFTAPATFLVLAFLPERAALWTEALLARLIPEGPRSPSSADPEIGLDEHEPARWPRFRYWLKTASLLASLMLMGGLTALLVGASPWGALGVSVALAAIPFLFSRWIIKKLRGVKIADEKDEPEFFAIMRELLRRINEKRAARGDKPLPMPELVVDPDEGPNAYATGPSAFHATVGVTVGLKRMLLDPEELRATLMRTLSSVGPSDEEFLVFRDAILETLPGASESMGPEELKTVVRRAADADLSKLGYEVLFGILGHEFGHVYPSESHPYVNDMLLGSVAGALASFISFISYPVLWAVGHGRLLWDGLLDLARGRRRAVRAPRSSAAAGAQESAEDRFRPEIVEPVSAGAATGAVVAALWLAKMLTVLWLPNMARLLQMAASRAREGHADEHGALLSRKPAMLGLGLGLMTHWRPPEGTRLDQRQLPRKLALAHIMTVSPIEQLENAGLLRGADRPGRPVEGKDEPLFNAHLTHPNTRGRIRLTYKMLLAMKAGNAPSSGVSGERGGPGAPLRMAAAEAASAVDPESEQSFSAPGLDARLLPVVEGPLRARIAAEPERFGHLAWTLHKIIDDGRAVRYAEIRAAVRAPSYYDSATRSLYMNRLHRRTHPALQAAVLAATLQKAYDDLNGNLRDARESWARQVMIQDAFIEDQDPMRLVEEIDLNNPLDGELFEGVMHNRLTVAQGAEEIGRVFGGYDGVRDVLAKAEEEQERLERSLDLLGRQLALVERGLERKENEPIRAALLRDQRVMKEKILILEGSVAVAQERVRMVARESRRAPASASLETPFSLDAGHRATIGPERLRVVAALSRPLDPGLAEVVRLLRTTVERSGSPEVRGLGRLLATLERIMHEGGRIRYASPGDDTAAYFDPVTLDLVIGRQFMRADPVLVAAMLVHELTHADDYFAGRALTQETESNAFTNEAVFIGAFDPREVASRIDPHNEMERMAYDLVYRARTRYIEGDTSLQAMISDSYTKLFGAHVDGLFTSGQKLESLVRGRLSPARQVILELAREETLLSQEAEGRGRGDARRLGQIRRELVLRRALLRLYERQAEQFRTD